MSRIHSIPPHTTHACKTSIKMQRLSIINGLPRNRSYTIKMWEECNEPIKVLLKFTSEGYSFSSTVRPKDRKPNLNSLKRQSTKLWHVLGDVLHRLPAKILTSIKPPSAFGLQVCGVLHRKILKICSTFSASVNLQHITPDSPPPMFSTFSTVTEDQVTKIITNSPSKSCSLDPWPTFLILDYMDILITCITSIINASFEQGKCPNFFKQAHVTPILKKHP